MLEIILRKEIEEKGPLTQSRLMELALCHPVYGYYGAHAGIGRDFTTAPEISQIFGELIGMWALDYYEKVGSPDSISVVELGPGNGTLMADFLRAAKVSPSFLKAIKIQLVEISPSLKEIQKKNVCHPSVEWYDTVDKIPFTSELLIIIANEFFDVLPTACYKRSDNVLYEKVVNIHENDLAFQYAPIRPEAGKDQIWEETPALKKIMEVIAPRLLKQQGALLCLDYGYEEGEGDSLQALFKGKPASPLAHIGQSDLTCHVNFGKLKEIALSLDLGVLGPLSQGQFLKNLGLDLRAAILKHKNPSQKASIEAATIRLTHPQQMGNLFKVMALFSPLFPEPIGFDV